METIEKTIEVDAPVSKVYNQWTQFEDFHRFMEGVEQVKQLDDKHLHWVAEVGGKKKEWDAEIVDQVPDQRISWRSTSGARNSGVVNFRPKDQNHTIITLEMYYEPEGAVEKAADALGLLSRKVEGDLERFRTFIQKRGTETGAWRGEIRGRDVKRNDAASTDGVNSSTNPPEYDNSGNSGLA
jgi:uncharacterized membrane protein